MLLQLHAKNQKSSKHWFFIKLDDLIFRLFWTTFDPKTLKQSYSKKNICVNFKCLWCCNLMEKNQKSSMYWLLIIPENLILGPFQISKCFRLILHLLNCNFMEKKSEKLLSMKVLWNLKNLILGPLSPKAQKPKRTLTLLNGDSDINVFMGILWYFSKPLVHKSPRGDDFWTILTSKMMPTILLSQLAFTCSKSTIEALQKGKKYVQSSQLKH